MENFIIGGILLALLALGAFYTVRHFKRQSGCCGGGGYKSKKKKLSRVLYQKRFAVEGMHCKQCKRRVEETVSDIKGVAGRVDLKKGILTVSYAENVADELIRAKIERAGYPVTEIQDAKYS